MVWFQWGYCPGLLPRPGSVYRLGDLVYWRPCDDGSIRAWVYFDRGGGNIGDPAIRDLIVRDAGQVFLMRPCLSCGAPLGGGALEVTDGVISRVWLARLDEFDEPAERVDVYTITEDGERVPRPDYTLHPMQPATDCVKG